MPLINRPLRSFTLMRRLDTSFMVMDASLMRLEPFLDGGETFFDSGGNLSRLRTVLNKMDP